MKIRGEISLLSSTSFRVACPDGTVNAVIKGKRLKGSEERNPQEGDWRRRKARDDNSLCVGDSVILENGAGGWRILEREKRRCSFSRYNFLKGRDQVIGANFDLLCVIAAHHSPRINSFFVNTALTGLTGESEVLFVFTKSDLAFEPIDNAVIGAIAGAGFEHVLASSFDGSGVDGLRAKLSGKTAILVGESGSGKSTLLNTLFGRDVQAVGELSGKSNTGCHVTTSSVLLQQGELRIIDTPGIRFVRPMTLGKERIVACFPDLSGLRCRYADCSHMGETGCLADEAAASGEISPLRLSDYRRMMDAGVFRM